MSQLILDSEKETDIPIEIVLKIIYQMGGLEHPVSKILKDYFSKHHVMKCCFGCSSKNESLCQVPISYLDHQKMNYWRTNLIQKNKLSTIKVCFTCAH